MHHLTHHWVLGQKTKQASVLYQFQSSTSNGPKPIREIQVASKGNRTTRIRPSPEAAVLPPKPHWIATQAHSTHTTCTCAVNSTTRLYKQNSRKGKGAKHQLTPHTSIPHSSLGSRTLEHNNQHITTMKIKPEAGGVSQLASKTNKSQVLAEPGGAAHG